MYGEIYKITNTVNNKVYIGQTTQGFRIRYKINKNTELNYGLYLYHKKMKEQDDKHCNEYLLKELELYGYNNFKIDEKIDRVIHYNKSDEELRKELDSKEKYWIRYYNATNPEYGYNKSPGGKGGYKLNDDCIKVVCLNNRKIFPSLAIASEYVDIKDYDSITNCCRGESNYAGKLKDGNRATWAFYDDYLNMTEEDIKFKISNTGIQQKTKKNNTKVICLNNGEIFGSVRKCAKYFNVNHGRISECCKGDREFIIIDGTEYKFKYYDEINN